MKKGYNNFRELDAEIKILQLQKDIAIAELQNRMRLTVENVKEQAAIPSWLKAVKVTKEIVYLSRYQIVSIATEFLLRKWLLREKKNKKQ